MRRALVWLNLYGSEAVRHKFKNRPKMHFLCFFGHFWAYVRQPHGHIGWAIPMPFASMNSTNPRTAPWNFHKKLLRIDRVEKWPYFESAFLKKKFALSPWKLVTNYVLEWMGLNFQYCDGLQPKIRVGIINEHECKLYIGVTIVSTYPLPVSGMAGGLIFWK